MFEYITCRKCRLIYLQPSPEADDYDAMYPPSYQNNEVANDIQENWYVKLHGLRFSYGYQFDLIKKHIGVGASILDYGCGTAHFIINAQKAGFRCEGAEYNPEYVNLLRSNLRGTRFSLINDLINEQEIKPGFDVIRLSNVLEHLTAPGPVLNKMAQHLNPGGIFLIEGPIEHNFCLATAFRNFYFWLQKKLRPGRSISAPPYHIFFSTRKNQKIFFLKWGFSELHFAVSEDPWPFPGSFRSAIGIKKKLMAVVAKISILFTKLFGAKWGNTFIYAGRMGR